MTAACFFRYAWIAPDRFEAMLPRSAALGALAGHLEQGRALARIIPQTALRAAAVTRLRAFAAEPLLRALPSLRLARSARHWAADQGEAEAEQLAGWSLTLHDRLADCTATAQDTADELAFLHALARSDFPVLLLWSNPALAHHLFVADGGGVTVVPVLSADRKALRKAAGTALRYACGAFGRFGLRGGWVGAGFAMVDTSDAPGVVQRRDERLCIEPDIAWIARNWLRGETLPIRPGEDAWSYASRALAGCGRGADRRETLEALRRHAGALRETAWSFTAASAFLEEAEARLARTVPVGRWRADPHRWWLTRVIARELRVPANLPHQAASLYAMARRALTSAGVGEGTPTPAAGPYPIRLAARAPDTLLCAGEDLTDCVIRATALAATPPFLPEAATCPAAIVLQADGAGVRYKLHEPNPRRTADLAARHMPRPPGYARSDPAARAISPPAGLVDQRLLRPAGPESAVADLPADSDAMFRSPLAGPEVAAQIARDLASPRYAGAPDLLPIPFNDASALALSYGRLDSEHGVWLLSAAEARALGRGYSSPGALAALYAVECHRRLGSPRWLTVLHEGRSSRIPTSAPVAFRWLLHACRTAAFPLVLRGECRIPAAPVLTDAQGSPLACELYVAQLEDDASSAVPRAACELA